MTAEIREEDFPYLWLNLVTGLGILLTIGGTGLGFILILSATFQNHCHSYLIKRPEVTLLNEMWIEIPTIIPTLMLMQLFKLIYL